MNKHPNPTDAKPCCEMCGRPITNGNRQAGAQHRRRYDLHVWLRIWQLVFLPGSAKGGDADKIPRWTALIGKLLPRGGAGDLAFGRLVVLPLVNPNVRLRIAQGERTY